MNEKTLIKIAERSESKEIDENSFEKIALDGETTLSPEEPEKAKKLKKKELKIMLEEIQQENDKLEEEKTRQGQAIGIALKLIIVLASVLIALIIMAITDFVIDVRLSSFKPRTNALEDAFISAKEKYDDGQHIFDFDGYMKKNGYHQTTIHFVSDTKDEILFSKHYKKGKIEVNLTGRVIYESNGTIYESKIKIERGNWNDDHPVYSANYTGNDPIYDKDGELIFLKEALYDLDKVIKGENIAKDHHCPFGGLHIEHTVSTDYTNNENLHDD